MRDADFIYTEGIELILKLIDRLFPPKDTSGKRFRKKMAEHIAGKSLKCVTEKIDNAEEVIGRDGMIVLRDGIIVVYSESDVLFSANIYELSAWELLSLEGVVLTAPDISHGGEERTVICYYKYWRKLET